MVIETPRNDIGSQTQQKRNESIRTPRAITIGLAAVAVTTLCAAQAIATDTYNYKGVCPYPNGGKKIHDKWYFWECECTSYVTDKLNERGVPFWLKYKKVDWGSAGNWLNAAKQTGTPYSKWPRRGDVAWWSGHVAYVQAVDSYGNVNVSEYNYGVPHDYHTRTIKHGTASYPTYFIHL